MGMTPLTPPRDVEEEEDKPMKRVNSELVMSELNRQAIIRSKAADEAERSVPQPKKPVRDASEHREMFQMDEADEDALSTHDEGKL